MLMIAGFIFIVAGIWRGAVVFIQMSKRPKIEATIVSKEKKKGFPPFKNKEHDFARINYRYNEHEFQNEEIALKIDAQIGDNILCFLDPENPKDIEQYAPKKDAIPVITVLSIGIILVVFSFWVINALE